MVYDVTIPSINCSVFWAKFQFPCKFGQFWRKFYFSHIFLDIFDAHNSKTRYDVILIFQHIFSFSTFRILYIKMATSEGEERGSAYPELENNQYLNSLQLLKCLTSSQAFSKNGKSTVLATNPSAQGLVGLNRERLSHMDKRMANIQYKCMGENIFQHYSFQHIAHFS